MSIFNEGDDDGVAFVEVETGHQGRPGTDASVGTKGPTIPSATTVNLSAFAGSFNHVSGTTDIESFATENAGVERVLVFDASLTLIHSASLILPGDVNFRAQAGSVLRLRAEGGAVWRAVGFQHIPFDKIAMLSPVEGDYLRWASGAWIVGALPPSPTFIGCVLSDQDTDITTGVKFTYYMVAAMTLTDILAEVGVASSSGAVTMTVKENGVLVHSGSVTIAQGANISGAVTLSDTALAKGSKIEVEITGAGTGAKAAKLTLIGTN